jgi:hypothetical protein
MTKEAKSMQENNYQLLMDKLDEFIRKYYKNQLIRGILYSITVVLLFYIAVAVLEHFARFDTAMRTALFWSFMIINGFILGRLVIIPLIKLYKLGRIISHEQAAEIIGKHFTEVKDKLLNVLQLKNNRANGESSDLVEASISQKIKELKPVPFAAAIDLSENKKYLRYAMIPVLLMVFILFSAPSILTDSTIRLVEHDTYFEKEAPFKFVITNSSLKTVQQEDYQLNVKLTGDEVPDNVFIIVGDNEYKLSKENTINFNYLFKNVQKNIRFQLSADGYISKEYELQALPNPILLNFDIALDYPAYLNKPDETVSNTGDLVIPAGTKVTWKFNTQNTKVLRMSFNDTAFAVNPAGDNAYSYTTRFLHNRTYSVTTSNEYLRSRDSVIYAVNVIPDLSPAIEVEERRDSMSNKQFYFRGKVRDDYGFSRLSFVYRLIAHQDSTELTEKEKQLNSVALPVNKTLNQDQFFHSWNLAEMNILPGDEVEYYFEVWDNDGVNGSKVTRSQKMLFKAPTLKDIAQKTEKNNSKIKSDLEESIKDAKDLQKELNDFNKKMMEKKQLGWEEKKKLENLLNKQKDLQQKVDDIKKENQQNNTQQNEFKQPDENLMEKQKQLEELFENIMTPEMKEKFKELEKLLDKLDKEKLQDAVDKMKLDSKDIEKELDRTLELFKQMEFQQKLDETIKKLDELSDKQDKLSEKSQEKNADTKQLEQKQEELNKEFEDVRKDLDDLEKKNSEMEKPNDMEKTEQQEQEIQKEMQESSQQLQSKQNKGASKSQKKASQQMKKMSEQLSSMQMQMQSQQQTEDINALREILENLVQLSFDQESLMDEVGKTQTNNPQFAKLGQKQKKLQDDSKIIEDSLQALAKRVPQVSAIVGREISAINMNMEKAVDEITESRAPSDGRDHKSMAASRQQLAMTSINNLALLLSEALKQMQQQMQSQMAGSGSCNKPGGKGQKPSMSNLRQMQEQLNKQIQQAKEAMEKGQKPGQKDGKGQQGGGSTGMSQELAKMAAQQEAIRQMMQKMADEMSKDGKGGSGNMGKMAQKMEETETDLVNKMITQETMKRQQDILTRLLEHEKAEKEREMDEQRQATESKNQNYSNPNEFFEYNRLKQKEVELLKTVPPSLNQFYKNKVNDYFNHFEQQ